jgi:hypothetical protein
VDSVYADLPAVLGVEAGGSEAAAGSILSSVLALSALLTSLAGVDTVALVGPPRRLELYLHETM